MYTVVLKRGPLPDKTWEHTTDRAAYRRAQALQDLHNCPIIHSGGLNRYVVVADLHYTKAKTK